VQRRNMMHQSMGYATRWIPKVALLFLLVLLSDLPILRAQSRIIPRSPTSPPVQVPPTGTSAARPSSPAGPVTVTLKDNRLSVEARDGDLRTVIERIAAQGNIEVRHLDSLPSTRVSLRFADLPTAEGLKRLFRAADVSGYALITETVDESVQVRRILFLPVAGGPTGVRPAGAPGRRPPTTPQPSAAPIAQAEPQSSETQQEGEQGAVATGSGGSIFEEFRTNTTARRLLSQLVHPNEQVRERALESLIQLVGDDQKQAQLLEFLEPLMEDMASDDKTAREDARAEIRKLLSR
jgi:hypothetical protein